MNWEKMVDHLIEEVGAEAVLEQIVSSTSLHKRYDLWRQIAKELNLKFHHEDDETDMYDTLLAEIGEEDLLDYILYLFLYEKGQEAVEFIVSDVGAFFDTYFTWEGNRI